MNGNLVWSEEKNREDEDKEEDVVAAELILDIAGSLSGDEDIRMTFDTPSKNVSGKMPVLDLKIWSTEGEVMFEYYEKPMASQFVVGKWSALPWRVKRSCLAGEVARRFFNTSPSLVEEGAVEVFLDSFRFKLLKSGYTMKERELIIREGTARYRNVVKSVSRGERPLYRSASWRKEERALGNLVKARSWYSPHDTVLFVQATPGEVLRRRIEDVVRKSGFKVKVVERGGRQVKSLLQKSDVHPQDQCWDNGCHVCLTGGGGKCNVEGVVYKIWCVDCERVGESAVMYGETGRTARIRIGEHIEQLRKRSSSSNLWEHCLQVHGGRIAEFASQVLKSCPGDPLTRQLSEAKRIDEYVGVSLNDKNEWQRPASIRVRGEAR